MARGVNDLKVEARKLRAQGGLRGLGRVGRALKEITVAPPGPREVRLKACTSELALWTLCASEFLL